VFTTNQLLGNAHLLLLLLHTWFLLLLLVVLLRAKHGRLA
jgi:hypothetical protein